ncbi:MAG: uracil-DNA glycosylase [Bacteroidia bacterium]
MPGSVKLHPSWLEVLKDEFSKPYFIELKNFLIQEKQSGQTVYPPGNRIFAALDEAPFEKVKVIILGQDPYHGTGQANGMCFSVNRGVTPPPSLKNIYKEIETDLGFLPPNHGDLSSWAANGVLLLNAVLTVRANQPASHQNQGWEIFTDTIIKTLSEQKSNIVFLLWGSFAKGKKALIDNQKHLILEAAHPSPFSAYNGFMGCKHFSKANTFLKEKGMEEIKWEL